MDMVLLRPIYRRLLIFSTVPNGSHSHRIELHTFSPTTKARKLGRGLHETFLDTLPQVTHRIL